MPRPIDRQSIPDRYPPPPSATIRHAVIPRPASFLVGIDEAAGFIEQIGRFAHLVKRKTGQVQELTTLGQQPFQIIAVLTQSSIFPLQLFQNRICSGVACGFVHTLPTKVLLDTKLHPRPEFQCARQAVISRLSCRWRRKSGSHAHPEENTFGRPDYYNTPRYTDKPVEPHLEPGAYWCESYGHSRPGKLRTICSSFDPTRQVAGEAKLAC